jgi:hypothetical protein
MADHFAQWSSTEESESSNLDFGENADADADADADAYYRATGNQFVQWSSTSDSLLSSDEPVGVDVGADGDGADGDGEEPRYRTDDPMTTDDRTTVEPDRTESNEVIHDANELLKPGVTVKFLSDVSGSSIAGDIHGTNHRMCQLRASIAKIYSDHGELIQKADTLLATSGRALYVVAQLRDDAYSAITLRASVVEFELSGKRGYPDGTIRSFTSIRDKHNYLGSTADEPALLHATVLRASAALLARNGPDLLKEMEIAQTLCNNLLYHGGAAACASRTAAVRVDAELSRAVTVGDGICMHSARTR